jgi:hypothetical protein
MREFFLGSGSVTLGGPTITTPQTYITCSSDKSLTPSLQIAANAVNQLYISPSNGALSVQQVAATGLAFPANSLAIAEVVSDSVALIRQSMM